MSLFEGHRRSFLLTVGGLGISQVLSKGLLEGQATIPAEGAGSGFVLGPKQGEHLIHFRDRGNIFIKQGAATGSEHLGMGTQQVMTGTGIPVHRHLKMDEAFLVLEGSGTVLLNDFPHSFEKGGTISIPHNTWHGFENPDHELLARGIGRLLSRDLQPARCSPKATHPRPDQRNRPQIRHRVPLTTPLKHSTLVSQSFVWGRDLGAWPILVASN